MPDPTYPPCESCLAHGDLEKDMSKLKQKNSDEHNAIIRKLEESVANIRWMNIIGRWILASLFGYFVILGYYILSHDYLDYKDKIELSKQIKAGEEQHYENEKNIAIIKQMVKEIHSETRRDK